MSMIDNNILQQYDITVTMTAIDRPEIVNRTLESFAEHLKNISFTDLHLNINIDVINDVSNINSIAKIVNKYFKTCSLYTSDTPNFPAALKRVWGDITTKFVFHIEDDWVLVSNLNIQDILDPLSHNNVIQSIIRPSLYTNHEYIKPCLSPSIIKTEYINSFIKVLTDDRNPEMQFEEWYNTLNCKYIFPTYPLKNKGGILEDIGREWLEYNSIFKKRIGNNRNWIRYE